MEGVFEMKINWKSKILACVTSLMVIFGAPFCAFSLDDYEIMHRLFVLCNFIDRSTVVKKLGPIFTDDPYADVSEKTRLLTSLKSLSFLERIMGPPEVKDVLPDVCKFFRTHRNMANRCLVDGNYPLFVAVNQQEVELVKCLIECGADVNCRSGPCRITPLFCAVVGDGKHEGSGDITIINILLSCKEIDVNARCGYGRVLNTPLGYAINKYGNDSTIANLLRAHGAHELDDDDSCCCTIM